MRWTYSAAKELAEGSEASSWQTTCELIHGNEENIVMMRQLGKFFVAIQSKAEVVATSGVRVAISKYVATRAHWIQWSHIACLL